MSEAPPVYPASDLDIPLKFQGQTGSYWSRDFRDRLTLAAIFQGRLRAFDQTQDFAVEVEQLISRFTCPVNHRERWMPLDFVLSNGSVTVDIPLEYGGNKALYGQANANPPYDRVFEYGDNLLAGTSYALPLPAGIVNIRMITNRITNPTVTMVEGVNCHILLDEGIITTDVDVFNDPRISTANFEGANRGDQRIRLWAYWVEYDRDYIWKHFGYIVGTRAPSSTNYRGLVNGIWDNHTAASNKGALYRILSSVMDVPYALEDGEVVELILTSPRTQVITDKNVYTVPDDASITVSVGDTLTRYQGLTDTVTVQDLRYIDDGLTVYSKRIAPDIPLSIYPAPAGTASGGIVDYTAYFDQDDAESVATPETLTEAAVTYGFSYQGPYGAVQATGQSGTTDILTANGLGDHTDLRIKFKLLLTGDWRGNSGPSTVSILVDGVPVKTTTFSNHRDITQAYPGDIGDNNPAFTGAARTAVATGTATEDVLARETKLWHPWRTPQVDGTAQYEISLTVPHTAPNATVSLVVTGIEDDNWTVSDLAPAVSRVLDITTGDETYGLGQATAFIMDLGTYTTAEFEAQYGFDPENPGLGGAPANFSYEYYKSNAWRTFESSITPITGGERVRLPWLNPAQVDNPDVPGITLTDSFLAGSYLGGLYFANKEVELEYVGVDDDGYVDVRFELSGYPGDIEAFWENAFETGKAQGYTLANYLDQRANPVGSPEPRHLPETVNPMLLVLRHIMGYNLFIIKLREGLEGPNAMGAEFLSVLRKTLPPHSAFIIFTEINVEVQEFDQPHYETLAVGQGPVITEVGGLTIDLRPPAVVGVPTYI
jgi:hypothetical protein